MPAVEGGAVPMAASQPGRRRLAPRELRGLTTPLEKRALAWLVVRLPGKVTPDHLTAVGFVAMLGGGVAHLLAARNPLWLLIVNALLVVNWFGDSLDGTLARHRRRERPRYGFYVDHLLDALGATALMGGLAASGLIEPILGVALLAGYLLVSIDMHLATHALGVFRMSRGGVGGTEVRLLLITVNALVLACPGFALAGYHLRTWDVCGTLALAALAGVLARAALETTRRLAREEPVRSG